MSRRADRDQLISRSLNSLFFVSSCQIHPSIHEYQSEVVLLVVVGADDVDGESMLADGGVEPAWNPGQAPFSLVSTQKSIHIYYTRTSAQLQEAGETGGETGGNRRRKPGTGN